MKENSSYSLDFYRDMLIFICQLLLIPAVLTCLTPVAVQEVEPYH